MRFVLVLSCAAMAFTGAALADAAPARLSALQMDRVTAGALSAGTLAAATATSDFLAATFTDSDTLLVTNPEPPPGSARGSVAITGGDALSWTSGQSDPRTAQVSNAVTATGFELGKVAVGGASSGRGIATFVTSTVYVLQTAVDPILLRP